MKKFNYLLISLIGLFIFSCNINESQQKPKDLRNESQQKIKELKNVNQDLNIGFSINLDGNNYIASIREARNFLRAFKFIVPASRKRNNDGEMYDKLAKSSGYLIFDVSINQATMVYFVLNLRNLRIEGTIDRLNLVYYMFKDSEIKEVDFRSNHLIGQSLGYNGDFGYYPGLKISNESIIAACDNIIAVNSEVLRKELYEDFITISYVTSEALKFFYITNDVERVLKNDSEQTSYNDNFISVISNWKKWSEEVYKFDFHNSDRYLSILKSDILID